MKSLPQNGLVYTIGLDLGDRFSTFRVLGHADGEFVESGQVLMTKEALSQRFGAYPRSRIAMEVGTHSPWVSRHLRSLGHQVIVANPRKFRLIAESLHKSDESDPETLARAARFDPRLLHPIQHRGAEHQSGLALLHTRDCLVRTRTQLINHVRGTVKSFGGRISGCSTDSFHHKALDSIPKEILPILRPAVRLIEDVTKEIHRFDKIVEKKLCERVYPQTKILREVPGVGPVTGLAFVLVVGDPARFKKSRRLGAYLGLVPGKRQSGQSDPQLRITKAGDGFLRRLLVASAHYILGPFGTDSDLRRHGEAICARGGKKAKKRAVVAVARKLAVLLHRLWVTGEQYDPLRNSKRKSRGELTSPH